MYYSRSVPKAITHAKGVLGNPHGFRGLAEMVQTAQAALQIQVMIHQKQIRYCFIHYDHRNVEEARLLRQIMTECENGRGCTDL